ncbi:MAG: dephospho-CoA kinase [Candidatus Xenobia bacterium]
MSPWRGEERGRTGPVFVIGLTGGMASGKSTVAAMLAARGAEVIDADLIARTVVSPGSPALQAIVARWGPSVLLPDGSLDRKGLGARVFGNPPDVAFLNALIHPAVAAEMQRRLAACEGVAVLMVPLLLETKAEQLCDQVWVVTAPQALRVARVETRDGLSAEQAQARMQNQWTDELRTAKADVVLVNEGDLPSLQKQVDIAWEAVKNNV